MGGDTEASRRDGQPTAVLDIDGTLARSDHRAAAADAVGKRWTPRWWDAFFDPGLVEKDEPIAGVRQQVENLAKLHKIVYLSGRRDTLVGVTRDWLRKHGFPEGEIILRPVGIPTTEFKPKAIADLKARANDVKVCIGDNESDLQACSVFEDAALVLVESNKPWEIRTSDDGEDGADDGHAHDEGGKCDACAQANSLGLLGNIAQDHGLDGWEKLHEDAMEGRITAEECSEKLMQKAMLKHDGDAIELIEEVQRLLKGGGA